MHIVVSLIINHIPKCFILPSNLYLKCYDSLLIIKIWQKVQSTDPDTTYIC